MNEDEIERGSEFVVAYNGRFIYNCSCCGTSNGGDLNNFQATRKLIHCGGCDYGIRLIDALEKWRKYRKWNPHLDRERR